MVRAGIVGATGYTGVELLRLLLRHDGVEVATVTSRGEAGRPIRDLFPNLLGWTDLAFSDPADAALESCDVVFFATPHNVAMQTVPALVDAGVRVVDLSADYRLRNVDVWESWYGESHTSPELCATSVYGLPERNRDSIGGARLVACPGCYPTSVQLGFMPFLEAGVIDPGRLIASSASGVSGAGRQAKVGNLLTEAGDSFKAYGVAGHRHLPEIEQELAVIAGGSVALTFVPHLVPMSRGIHSTLFATLTDTSAAVQDILASRYADEPFVTVLPAGQLPETRSVRGANTAQIAVTRPQGRDVLVISVVIDNLVKGAAGQAVQAMNLMFDYPETAGLDVIALIP